MPLSALPVPDHEHQPVPGRLARLEGFGLLILEALVERVEVHSDGFLQGAGRAVLRAARRMLCTEFLHALVQEGTDGLGMLRLQVVGVERGGAGLVMGEVLEHGLAFLPVVTRCNESSCPVRRVG